jgi:hypothetical protein
MSGEQEEILLQLRVYGLRYRLGLAESRELRQIADDALNAEIYSPSLVDAALDAAEWLHSIGAAFELALQELAIMLPESDEDCCRALVAYYVGAIANQNVNPQQGLIGIKEIYYSYLFCEQGQNTISDNLGILEFMGLYWSYDDLSNELMNCTVNGLSGEAAIVEFDKEVIEACQGWLRERRL